MDDWQERQRLSARLSFLFRPARRQRGEDGEKVCRPWYNRLPLFPPGGKGGEGDLAAASCGESKPTLNDEGEDNQNAPPIFFSELVFGDETNVSMTSEQACQAPVAASTEYGVPAVLGKQSSGFLVVPGTWVIHGPAARSQVPVRVPCPYAHHLTPF